MQVFHAEMLNELTSEARLSQRLRKHRNIHTSYQDPCQRLFNAIEPGSYIRPHRHVAESRDELLVAIRGLMALLSFDDRGAISEVIPFGSDRYGERVAVGVEVPVGTWHTVLALVPGCVLLEVKEGPFDPNQAKDYAPWAAEEGSDRVPEYLSSLLSACRLW